MLPEFYLEFLLKIRRLFIFLSTMTQGIRLRR